MPENGQIGLQGGFAGEALDGREDTGLRNPLAGDKLAKQGSGSTHGASKKPGAIHFVDWIKRRVNAEQ